MKLMGATWRRTGLSKAAMRSYYNDVHGPICATDPAEIIRYVQNVVDDAVFYAKDAHVPLTPPDGLTELFHVDQEALLRTFATPYYAEVAWPDTLVYADLARAISVAGQEKAVLPAKDDMPGSTKVMSFVLVPSAALPRAAGSWDAIAEVLRSRDLDNFGVVGCDLVTEFQQPYPGIARLFERPGPRAVAGITAFLQPDAPWEIPLLGDALVQAASELFATDAFVLTMLVAPSIVIDRAREFNLER